MKKLSFVLVLLVALASSAAAVGRIKLRNPFAWARKCDPVERAALMELYDKTGGEKWRYNTNWGKGDPCKRRWAGVFCDINRSTRRWTIIGITLRRNNLRGRLDSIKWVNETKQAAMQSAKYQGLHHLGQKGVPADVNSVLQDFLAKDVAVALPKLVKIDLRGNDELSGSIPRAVYQLPNLEQLDLSECKFSGSVSSEIAALVRLRELDLSFNNLSSMIPSSAMGKLEALECLRLAGNRFEGPVPDVANLKRLRTILLSFNRFDAIPQSFCMINKFAFINVSHNRLPYSLEEFYRSCPEQE